MRLTEDNLEKWKHALVVSLRCKSQGLELHLFSEKKNFFCVQNQVQLAPHTPGYSMKKLVRRIAHLSTHMLWLAEKKGF